MKTEVMKMLLSTKVMFLKALFDLCINKLQCILATGLSRAHCFLGETNRHLGGAPEVTTLDAGYKKSAVAPTSVNYHFTRQCNYKCGFCFHTAKTSFVLPIEEAKKGLKLLKEAGRFSQ